MLWAKCLTNRVSLLRHVTLTRTTLSNCLKCRQFKTDANTNVTKDVVLYKHANQKFYTAISVFGVCQVGFWTYLSYFAFNYLRDAPTKTDQTARWFEKINLGSNKYRYSLTGFFLLIGTMIMFVSLMYPMRSIKYVVLNKGGKELTFVTYGPFGINQLIRIGLENVSCTSTRQNCPAWMGLKLKGQPWFFLIDMRGDFRNTQLFDATAGLQRAWKSK